MKIGHLKVQMDRLVFPYLIVSCYSTLVYTDMRAKSQRLIWGMQVGEFLSPTGGKNYIHPEVQIRYLI